MNDLRFALRQLWKSPGFTVIAVLTLALGIGSSTAIFSTVDAVLFRPLPYPQPERLVQLHETLPDGSLNSVSGGVFLDWRERQSQFECLALANPVTRNLRMEDAPEQLSGLEVTHEFLRVLGLQPSRGRGFEAANEQPGDARRVVLITDELWRSRLGASESILGSKLVLDEEPHTIIGVLPPNSLHRGIWSPGAANYLIPVVTRRDASARFGRATHWASVYGRLQSGVSVRAADALLKAIKQQLNPQYPAYKRDWGTAVQTLHDRLAGGPRPMLHLLLGAVAVVLLIACANVANLLLARARDRQQEMALRAALGASAGRMVRQVLTESLVLAVLGGVAGTVLAVWGVQVLRHATADLLPGGMAPHIDGRILLFALALTGLTGLVFGILPAWQSRRPDVNEALKNSGRSATKRGRHRAQSMLVIAEVGLTVVLLAGAGLLLRSLANAVQTDPGFDPQRALAFDLSLPAATYRTDGARFAFSREALARIRALPGVEAAGTGMGIPFSGGSFGEGVRRSDQTTTPNAPIARINYVSEGYLEGLGTRLLAGRTLQESDNRTNAARVVVVNETVARKFFPGEQAIGRNVSLLGNDWQIVGVIADVPERQVDQPSKLFLYVPHVFNSRRFSIVVRTRLEPRSLIGGIRSELQRLDPGLALANVRSLDQAMTGSMNQRRIVLGLIGSFAGAALLLACVGLYGVMAFSVAMRRRELSIRLALGATRPGVIGLILRDGAWLTSAGLFAGVAGTLAAGRWLASQLYQVSPLDPVVLGGTVLGISLVTLMACWLPAWRTTRLDPVVALRSE